jgi:putative ABC transport system permease protein
MCSLRMLRKSPGFVGIVVLTLALGIGSNAAIFSIVNAVLIKPLPYPHPEQLMNIWRLQESGKRGSSSIADLKDLQEQGSLFEGISAWSTKRFNLRGSSEPDVTNGAYVSANFFSVMQAPMFLGTGFAENADVPGQDHVAVLGHDFWLNHFGGERNLIGKTVLIDGESYTVIGVAPKNFQFPELGTNVWIPLSPSREQLERSHHEFLAIGRLRPGVSLEQANQQLNVVSARLALAYPETDAGLRSLLIPLKTALVGTMRKNLLIAFGVAGFVFLIACANVSSLLLSRMTARQREIATRVALGARQISLLRQFFVENLMLAILGAMLAMLAARWSIWAIVTLGSHYLSDFEHLQPDATVFGFALAMATMAAAVISVVIAWGTTNVNLWEALKEGGKTAGPGRAGGRRQRVLVVAQIATAFLLLTGAGALIKSLVNLSHVNPGFNTDHVLTMRIQRPPAKSLEQPQLTRFFDAALATVQSVPGVESAGIVTYLPMQDWGTNIPIEIKNSAIVPGAEPSAEIRAISSQYYRAMSIAILAGRGFNEGEDSQEVVVVNRRFAKEYLPNQDAIGKEIRLPGAARWATIVGVAEDCRQVGLDSAPLPEVDVPYSQSLWTVLTANMSLAVRTTRAPLSMAREIQRALYSVDPEQGVFDVKVMADIVAETQADERFLTRLLALFSGLALVLAACGLFGQMFHAVSQQTHEIGVRVALGAQRGDVLKLVITQGAKLTALGLALGLGASLALMRFIAHLLYGGRAIDPFVSALSGLLLAAVALLACYLPARRAMRIDPAFALRCE